MDYVQINALYVYSFKLNRNTFYLRKSFVIAVCFLWLSLPGDYWVTDEALLAETT